MKQAENRFTAELPLPKPAMGGAMSSKRGPYAGAIKLGCPHHGIRVTAGKSQAEFARIANVSERTLRAWVSGLAVSELTTERIIRALSICGVSYARAMEPYERHKKRLAVRYRCAMTGQTWSGRGLKPKWLSVALDHGARLADFEVRA